MKKTALAFFMAILIMLQLFLPSYFLFDALDREHKVTSYGNEYVLEFDEINFLGDTEGYNFNFSYNYTIANPGKKYDDISWGVDIFMVDNLAVAKNEKGETVFYDADNLTKEEREKVEAFLPSALSSQGFYADEYEFCGSIKNEEEFYNLVVKKAEKIHDDEKFPTFDEFKSGEYKQNPDSSFDWMVCHALIKGSIIVQLYDGAMKIKEVRLGEETIMKLKQ